MWRCSSSRRSRNCLRPGPSGSSAQGAARAGGSNAGHRSAAQAARARRARGRPLNGLVRLGLLNDGQQTRLSRARHRHQTRAYFLNRHHRRVVSAGIHQPTWPSVSGDRGVSHGATDMSAIEIVRLGDGDERAEVAIGLAGRSSALERDEDGDHGRRGGGLFQPYSHRLAAAKTVASPVGKATSIWAERRASGSVPH